MPQSAGLTKVADRRPPSPFDVDAGELALRRVEVVAEVEQVGVEPDGLAAAEQVAVGVGRADAGAVDGGVARRDADQVALALGHVDEDRQVALARPAPSPSRTRTEPRPSTFASDRRMSASALGEYGSPGSA